MKYVFLCSNLTLWGSTIIIRSLPMKGKKVWFMTCLLLLPHIPAMFVTSLIQTETCAQRGGTDGGVLATVQTSISNRKGPEMD